MLVQIVLSSTFIFIVLLLIEKKIYDKRINRLAIRILVNGTRGKSSVTEFITAALTASEKTTVGKITGILPTLIISDGTKRIIKRYNGARVQEQFKVVIFAAQQKADVLVLECMSISPELQRLESRTFKPHIYVITNILNDHQEELGQSEKEQAEAICSAIPANSIVVTNENTFLDLIKLHASRKNSIVYACNNNVETLDNVKSIDKDNMVIALQVCQILKLDFEKSKEAMLNVIAKRTPIYTEINRDGKVIKFINAFAANEPKSTEKILQMFEDEQGTIINKIFIFNSRSDRPLRTIEFVKWLAIVRNIQRIYLIGTHSLKAKKELLRIGFDDSMLVIMKDNELKRLLEDVDNISGNQITIIGIGNIADGGFKVCNLFTQSSVLEDIKI